MIWIAVDAMGGDEAPRNVVDGALAAVRHFDLGVLLVGRADAVGAELERHAGDRARVRIVEAADVVGMAESPALALRRKPASSIKIAADAVAKGEASALVSAGHTGATVMAAHSAFGMLQGVDRPALAAVIPTRRRPALLLDVGASVECRPQHLLQFAVMGSMFARVVYEIEKPRIGLLSIGHEETKGNELTREAHQLLIPGAEHLRDRALLQVEARGVDRGQVLRVPENVDEALGFALRARDLPALGEDDRPAHDREREQQKEHALDDGARPGDHLHDGLLRTRNRERLGLRQQLADGGHPHPRAHLTPTEPSREGPERGR